MSAQSSEHDSHDLIRLGGETAVVVPVHVYRMLKALRDRASIGDSAFRRSSTATGTAPANASKN